MLEWIGSMFSSSWVASWHPDDALRARVPIRGSDYRDSLPDDFQAVIDAYAPFVKPHRWTFGLLDMWSPKAKMVKHAVHIPCWDSYKLNPCLWRGVCFGRTPSECYWTGLRQMRWARATYGGALGTEYLFPVQDVGRHGYKSDIKALCWLYFSMSCLFSCGVGQVFSLCGNLGCNFGACYSCHAREKLRRKFHLPPAFGLPPGVDDCLVHFLCIYCASHQELRELVLRGVDGPGMHVLDVLPGSYKHIPGSTDAIAKRHKAVADMVANPPVLFMSRGKKAGTTDVQMPALGPVTLVASRLMEEPDEELIAKLDKAELGWCRHCCTAPGVQSMEPRRESVLRRTRSEEVMLTAEEAKLKDFAIMTRAWSVAY